MMIEKIILNHLSDVLEVPVYMEVPENAPDFFVVLEKTGSQRENRIVTSLFAVQSYAPSMLEAAELNEQVKTAMDDLIYLPEITASKLQGDYNFTDPTTKRYRYQAGYNVTHY